MSMSTGGVQRLISTNPIAETSTDPNAATSPRVSSAPGERSTSRPTPAMPMPAAAIRAMPARSPISRAASAITASGDVAWRVDARPPGSR